MTEHFTIFTHLPTPEFLATLEANGIAVRGWSRRYARYRNRRQTVKTPQGWINPNDPYGDLKLSVPSRSDYEDARQLVITLGERHGIEVAIGGCVIGQ